MREECEWVPFVLSALDQTRSQTQPPIVNSDRGSHFTSQVHLGRLEMAGVQISMDGKGRALD